MVLCRPEALFRLIIIMESFSKDLDCWLKFSYYRFMPAFFDEKYSKVNTDHLPVNLSSYQLIFASCVETIPLFLRDVTGNILIYILLCSV